MEKPSFFPPPRVLPAPLLINGREATHLRDTGARLSVLTANEAKRPGMTIREIVIGSTTFRDVAFAILPDVEPWRSMPPAQGGIIGIPILLPLGCIRWLKGGTWELDRNVIEGSSDTTNMVFTEITCLLLG